MKNLLNVKIMYTKDKNISFIKHLQNIIINRIKSK